MAFIYAVLFVLHLGYHFLLLLVLKFILEECCSKCVEAELHHLCLFTPLLFWHAYFNPF